MLAGSISGRFNLGFNPGLYLTFLLYTCTPNVCIVHGSLIWISNMHSLPYIVHIFILYKRNVQQSEVFGMFCPQKMCIELFAWSCTLQNPVKDKCILQVEVFLQNSNIRGCPKFTFSICTRDLNLQNPDLH